MKLNKMFPLKINILVPKKEKKCSNDETSRVKDIHSYGYLSLLKDL
jgi:hypothetical protein